MLIAGVLSFDSLGRILLTLDPPVSFNGGTPIGVDGGLATAPGADPEVYMAAIGYADGDRITDSVSPLLPGSNPISNELGQIRVSTDPPSYWYAGLPFTADGRLSTAPLGPPPVDEFAYDDSFDSAFDIEAPP